MTQADTPKIRCDIHGLTRQQLAKLTVELDYIIESSDEAKGPAIEHYIEGNKTFATEDEFREEHRKVVYMATELEASATVKSSYPYSPDAPPKYQAEN